MDYKYKYLKYKNKYLQYRNKYLQLGGLFKNNITYKFDNVEVSYVRKGTDDDGIAYFIDTDNIEKSKNGLFIYIENPKIKNWSGGHVYDVDSYFIFQEKNGAAFVAVKNEQRIVSRIKAYRQPKKKSPTSVSHLNGILPNGL